MVCSPNAPEERKAEVEKLFKFVGRFAGKAILDGWQLDFPLSDSLFKVTALGVACVACVVKVETEGPQPHHALQVMMSEKLSWEDLRSLFPAYEKSLRPLLQLSREKHQIQRDSHLVRGPALPFSLFFSSFLFANRVIV